MPSKLILDTISNLADEGKVYFASDLSLDLSSVAEHILLPQGTGSQREEAPPLGTLRWNTEDKAIDYYAGAGWRQVSVEEDYDNIIRVGSTLYLDTFDRDSYFGVGTSWSNLSKFIQVQPELVGGIILQQSSQSFTFNAVDQYANVQATFSTEAMYDGTGSSYSFWFRADSGLNYGTNNYDKILFSILDSSDNVVLKIGVHPNGTGIYYQDNNVAGSVQGSVNYNNDTWYNLVLTRPEGNSAQNTQVYINGVNIGQFASTNPTYSSGAYVSIGAAVGGSSSISFFGGNISFVLVHERQLSAAEVLSNFEAIKYRYGY